jgi:hypothetical protein
MIRCNDVRARLVLALTAVSMLALAGPVAAQDTKATIQVETAGGPAMNMDYWTSGDSIRIDMSQGQDMSIVWHSGASPTMLMIQHAERRYMEWGEQQFQMMRQMMQRVGGAGGGGDTPDVDLTRLGFEPTGRSETIGPWDASEVRITGMDGQQAAMWIAPSLEGGLFELFSQMGDALEALQMPMLGGGMGGPQQQLMRYRQMREAAGLPDGGVVRMNTTDENGDTTITLQAMDQSAFDGNPFAAPAGYEKMQMPNLPE